MKRVLACTALSLSLALPGISEAQGGPPHGGGGYHHHDAADAIGHVLAAPFIAVGAVLGLTAAVVTAPLYAASDAVQVQPEYAAPPAYGYAPSPAYNAYPPPPPRAYGYYAPGAYGYAPRACVYYSDGSCR
ncbi:MAG: hypothetical protein QM661_04960 [Solimonas sp.]